MSSTLSAKTFASWPDAVIYIHPFTHETISKNIPSMSEVTKPTVGWFFQFLFDGQLPESIPLNFSMRLNNKLISYKNNFFDSLQSYLSQDLQKYYVIEPRIIVGLPGGKGGFGSMLRAQGNRMNSKKTTNNDACRDLSGRRLKTVRAAEKLAEYIEGETERKQIKKAKIVSKINRGLKQPTEQKVRFEDHDYLKECDTLKNDVRDAVQLAISTVGTNTSVKNQPNKITSIFDDDLDSDESDSNSESAVSETPSDNESSKSYPEDSDSSSSNIEPAK